MDINILKKIGFSDKSANVYLTLLRLGPSSVRKLAESCELNRGTTYDILNWLKERGIVTFYHQETKQYFVAEAPSKLPALVHEQQAELKDAEKRLEKMIPELEAIYDNGGNRPVARYYAKDELRQILEDILKTCEETGEHLYRIYSAEGIRPYVYADFPTFSDARVSKNISVRVVAIGEGGELRGLDERKWMKGTEAKPTYIVIYPGKTAYISLDAKQEPVGVVIDNDGVYETQKMIFDQLWQTL